MYRTPAELSWNVTMMSPRHLVSKIPWTDLLEHIQFAPEPTPIEPRRPMPFLYPQSQWDLVPVSNSSQPYIAKPAVPSESPIEPDFEVRPTSDDTTRQTATLDFTRAFVSLIVEHANARISVLPKPNAWHTSGLVDNEQLFPPSLISKMLWGHVVKNYCTLSTWSGSSTIGSNAFFLIIFALNYPENPYEYLPTLLYLAQHPRIRFSESQDLHRSPHGYGFPGLGAYASQTIARYLFVNLVDAMSGFQGVKKRTLGFPQRQRDWHVDVADDDKTIADEQLHLPFWISNPNSVYDTAERQRYLERCFHFIVSWYAIMREAAVRDWALGLTEVPAFGENEFLKMVLDELELICSAFKVDAPPPIPVAPPSPMADVVEVVNYGPSLFTALPVELQMSIVSFLPRSSLFSIIRISRQMRAVFTPILYADPLGAISPVRRLWTDRIIKPAYDRAEQSRLPRLLSSLASNPSARKSLRCLHIGVPALDFWGVKKAFFLEDLLGDTRLEGIRELWVYPDNSKSPSGWGEASPGQVYRHGVYDFARLFPGLSTLHFIGLERRYFYQDAGHELQHCNALPPLWKSLRHLTVRLRWIHLDVFRHIIAASASTLQSLNFHLPEAQPIEEDEWRRFPVCPNVRELTISISHNFPWLQALLHRCFPSVISLNIKSGPLKYDALDLSVSAPRLEHVQFTSMFPGTRLPSTIKTVSVRVMRDIFCEAGGGGLGQPEAAMFGALLGNMRYRIIRFAGDAWPGLRSLELLQGVDIEELLTPIATHLPRLEILIVVVHKWSYRPRRMDYPVDDGLDEEQRVCAARFFETCKGLSVISFNGIPGEGEKAKVPHRVWTKVDGSSEARMTVGGELKWRLSEVGRGVMPAVEYDIY